MRDELREHELNPMFTRKVKPKSASELHRIAHLNARVKEDPSAMLELSEIAYMRQLRENSVNEGE